MQDDFGTFSDETPRHEFADAGGAAGDENDLVLESHDRRWGGLGAAFYGERPDLLKATTPANFRGL
jgi:hypothetical protein